MKLPNLMSKLYYTACVEFLGLVVATFLVQTLNNVEGYLSEQDHV